jgi:hypothetical protein
MSASHTTLGGSYRAADAASPPSSLTVAGDQKSMAPDSGDVRSGVDEISGVMNPGDAAGAGLTQQSTQQAPAQRQRRRRRWFSLSRRSSSESEDSTAETSSAPAPAAAVVEGPAPAAVAVPQIGRSASSSARAASHALGAEGSGSLRLQTGSASSSRGVPQTPVGASETALLNHNSDLAASPSSTPLGGGASASHGDMAFRQAGSGGSPFREAADSWDGLAEPISASTCNRDTVLCTKCRHVFHFGCLSHWLHQCMVGMRPTVCPLCQRTIDVDVVLNPMMLFRKGQHVDGLGPLDDGGDGLDDSVCHLL